MKKLKIKKKIKFIYVPIYDFNIWYFKGWGREEMKDYLFENYKFDNFNDKDNIGGSVILLPVWVSKKGEDTYKSTVYCLYIPDENNLGIIAHEVFHIVSRVLRNLIGIDLTDSSEESFAYLMSYICNELRS